MRVRRSTRSRSTIAFVVRAPATCGRGCLAMKSRLTGACVRAARLARTNALFCAVHRNRTLLRVRCSRSRSTIALVARRCGVARARVRVCACACARVCLCVLQLRQPIFSVRQQRRCWQRRNACRHSPVVRVTKAAWEEVRARFCASWLGSRSTIVRACLCVRQLRQPIFSVRQQQRRCWQRRRR